MERYPSLQWTSKIEAASRAFKTLLTIGTTSTHKENFFSLSWQTKMAAHFLGWRFYYFPTFFLPKISYKYDQKDYIWQFSFSCNYIILWKQDREIMLWYWQNNQLFHKVAGLFVLKPTGSQISGFSELALSEATQNLGSVI